MKMIITSGSAASLLRNGAFSIYILLLSLATTTAQISDPVPEPIEDSGIRVKLKEFVTIPPSNSPSSGARINLLSEVPDGSGRLAVVDLNGFMYLIDEGVVNLYLNLKGEFPEFIPVPGKGTGFGAFCFHPLFAENGLFYTAHSESAGAGTPDFAANEGPVAMQWVIIEWKATDPSAMSYEGTSREIMRLDFPHEIHGTQEIAFNPTVAAGDPDFGMLYICHGEGGSSLHYHNGNLQTLDSYLGTIFRIDPLGSNSANGQYGIPPDNPFVDGDPNTMDEIWVYGFRNPHRITWDLEGSHRMFVGDIGEMNIEELNVLEKGKNYGWADREGPFFYDRSLGRENVYPLPADDTMFNYTYPVAMYDHDEGNAIVLGHVYRGQNLPELYGQVICGDIVSGRVFIVPESSLVDGEQQLFKELFFVSEQGNPVTLLNITPGSRADLRFGIDNNREIYILTKSDGKIRMVESILSSTDVVTNQIEKCTISPNPVVHTLRVESSKQLHSGASILIFDQAGNVVHSQPIQQSVTPELDITHLASGIYRVAIHEKSGYVCGSAFIVP